MFASCLHYISAFLNRHSKEQRYVAYVLDKEKARLKVTMEHELYAVDQTTEELRTRWNAQKLHVVSSSKDIERLEEEVQDRWQQRSVLTKFLVAIMNFLASYTHVLCYIVACITHAHCGGLVTLPLPLLVFLWATLSSPRPSKLFWIIMITYTELIILVQFIFQFDFIWDMFGPLDPSRTFYLPHVLGLQRQRSFAAWNVTLLVCLFLHRYMLRRIGLWNDEPSSDEQENDRRRPSLTSLGVGSMEQSEETTFSDGIAEQNEKKRTGLTLFLHELRHPKIRYIRDLYPSLFFLDFFCMCILIVFYSQFGEASSNSSVLTSSRIPVMFVVMIFIFTFMMIIDRALYLRKSVKWKLVYQLFTVILLHSWMLGILPFVTKIKASDNVAARWFYIFKCMYLVTSAWQIRNGYPKLCVGHLLTSSYGFANYVLFNVYMNLPCLFEMRTVVDWTWTETSMPIMDFIKMEMFYAKIYLVKCSRMFDENFPSPRGMSKSTLSKYLTGLPMIFGIILLVLSPLVLFSLINHIGEQTGTQRIDLTMSVEGYPPLYKMSAQGGDIRRGTWQDKTSDRQTLTDMFSTGAGTPSQQRVAVSFINDYFASERSDFLRARFRPDSNEVWPISEESLASMRENLNNVSKAENGIKFLFKLQFSRIRLDINSEPVTHSLDRAIEVDKELARQILDAVDKPGSQFEIPYILPYFLVIPNEGQIRNADQLMNVLNDNSTLVYSNATFRMKLEQNHQLWTMQFNANKTVEEHMFAVERVGYDSRSDLTYIPMIFFVDRQFPSLLAQITKGGIATMYFAIVLVIARFVRNFITTNPLDVIVTELPNPDHILKIFLDIYLVREARDFVLEEDLFAKLIFLFRSPATLIKWSRPKVD